MPEEQLPGLPKAAFDKLDPSPDAEFYADPRFVTHIDEGAIAAVTQVYRERLPPDGAVLDLMSSWVSHLPDEVAYAAVVGHGMNAEELAAIHACRVVLFRISTSSLRCPLAMLTSMATWTPPMWRSGGATTGLCVRCFRRVAAAACKVLMHRSRFRCRWC